MKKIIITSILMAVTSGLMYAQEAMSFTVVPHDNASMSMGQTVSSSASLVDGEVVSGSVGLLQWMPQSLKSNDINIRSSWSNGSFGFGVEYIGGASSEYYVTGEDGFYTESFKPSTMQFGLAAAYKISGKVRVGADVHYASETLALGSDLSAFYANLSAKVNLGDINVTGGLSRLGSSVKDESGKSFSMPTSLFVSGDYLKTMSDALSLRAMAEAQVYFTGGLGLGVGAEARISNILFVRSGYHFATEGSPLPSFLSVGAGVSFSGVEIQTCYLMASPSVGGSLGLSLGFRF